MSCQASVGTLVLPGHGGIYRPGDCTLFTAWFALGEATRIVLLLSKCRTLAATPFIYPVTLTADPVLFLNVGLKRTGAELSLVAMGTVMPMYSQVAPLWPRLFYVVQAISHEPLVKVHVAKGFTEPLGIATKCLLLLEPRNLSPFTV